MAIKGELSILSIWDGTAYRPVACLTNNSLTQSLSIIESQTKCDPGVVKKSAGTLNYNISLEGEYIDTTSVGGDSAKASHDFLMEIQNDQASGAKPAEAWKLETNVNDSNFKTYYGDAIISELTLDAPAGDELQTFSATLEGSGLIVEADPKA